MKNTAVTDLTKGNIIKSLTAFFLPIAAGNLFQTLYNMVDTIVVGKYVGTTALAAVGGSVSLLVFFFVFLMNGLLTGGTVVISQHFGAGNKEQVKKACATAYTFAVILGAVFTAVLVFASPSLIRMMNTPADTYDYSVTYARVYFAGSLFFMVYSGGSNILRALGDSKNPFIYLVAGCITNIVLDLVFVICFGLEVFGVALATTISQMVSAVLVLFRLSKKGGEYRLNILKFNVDRATLKKMLVIGVPAMLQSAIYNITNLYIQAAVNSLGTVFVASWALTSKIDGFIFAVNSAASAALVTFVGQNFGAGQKDRIRKGVRDSLIIFSAYTVLMCGIIYLSGKGIFTLFSNDPEVLEKSWMIMTMFLPWYILFTVMDIYSAGLKGIGDAVVPVIICFICIAVFRMLWMYFLFGKYGTPQMLVLVYPISCALNIIALGTRYYTKLKRLNLSPKETEEAL